MIRNMDDGLTARRSENTISQSRPSLTSIVDAFSARVLMSKKIVIVESDTAFSKKLKDELTKTGFAVLETGDGKGAYDLCRKEKPDLVVLAVELSAGQSGYLVCGKLKKDDELKKTPVVIIGKDPEGFEGHKKLKTRAEEYLKKPFAPEALTVKVGVLIGLPSDKANEEEVVVDDLNLGALDELSASPAAAEPARTISGDPDLDMLDQAFEDMSGEVTVVNQQLPNLSALLGKDSRPSDMLGKSAAPPPEPEAAKASANAEEDDALAILGGEEHHDIDLGVEIDETSPKVDAAAPKAARAPRAAAANAAAAAANDAEVQGLRGKVAELEEKITQLENSIAERDTELAGAKAASGGAKDVVALKDASLKKDKEIIRIKAELNEKSKELTEKDTELLELKEKEAAFEGKEAEHAQEVAKRDAQIKTLQVKVEQLTAEKKKADAAVSQAKDESRAGAASLATAQGELDQAQDQIQELTRQVEELQSKSAQLSQELEAARAEVDGAKRVHQGELDSTRAELDGVRAELEQSRGEVNQVRGDLESKVQSAEAEVEQLKGRIGDLEQTNAKNEDRVVKAYQKIKGDEKLREKTRKAIGVALQLLDENAAAGVLDEPPPSA